MNDSSLFLTIAWLALMTTLVFAYSGRGTMVAAARRLSLMCLLGTLFSFGIAFRSVLGDFGLIPALPSLLLLIHCLLADSLGIIAGRQAFARRLWLPIGATLLLVTGAGYRNIGLGWACAACAVALVDLVGASRTRTRPQGRRAMVNALGALAAMHGLTMLVLLGALLAKGMPETVPPGSPVASIMVAAGLTAACLFGLLIAALIQADRAELTRLAFTDSLTGVLNRRGLHNAIHHLSDSRGRRGGPMVLAVLDIDHFKSINDGHGHSVGDHVLLAFAEHCRQTLRTNDLIGRWGGEEFVVWLRDIDLAAAARVLSRLRAELPAICQQRGLPEATVSIGCTAVSPIDEIDVEALVARADAALYRAKDAGRNQIHVGGDHAGRLTDSGTFTVAELAGRSA